MRYSMKRVIASVLSLTMLLSVPLMAYAVSDHIVDAYKPGPNVHPWTPELQDEYGIKSCTKTGTDTDTCTSSRHYHGPEVTPTPTPTPPPTDPTPTPTPTPTSKPTGTKTDTDTDTNTNTNTNTGAYEEPDVPVTVEELMNGLLAIRVMAQDNGGDKFEVDNEREIAVEQGHKTDLSAELVYVESKADDVTKALEKFIRWDLVPQAGVTKDPTALGINLKAETGVNNEITTGADTKSEDEFFLRVYVDLNGNKKMDTEDGYDYSFNPPRKTTEREAATALYIPFNVIKYAKEIKLDPKYEGWTYYTKHTVDLKARLVDENGDKLSKREKVVFSTGNKKLATIDKNGFVVLKNKVDATGVAITAVTEAKNASTVVTLPIASGVASKKIQSSVTDTALLPKPNKPTAIRIDLVEGEPVTVEIGVDSVRSATDGSTTDDIIWTSKKPNIVSVGESTPEDNRGKTQEEALTKSFKVKLTGWSVGKTTVTAKASNGKKVNFTVTVTAPLKEMRVSESGRENEVISGRKLYAGQSVQLVAVKNPSKNTTAVKWAVVPAGSINENGLIQENATKAYKPTLAKGKDVLNGVKVSSKGVLSVAKTATAKDMNIAVIAYCYDKDHKRNVISKPYVISSIALSPIQSVTAISGNGDVNAKKAEIWNGQKYMAEATYTTASGEVIEDVNLVKDLESWTSNKAKIAYIKAITGEIKTSSTGAVKSDTQSLTKGKSTVKVSVPARNAKGKGTVINKTKALTVKTAVTGIQMKKSVVGVAPGKTVKLQISKTLPAKSASKTYTWTATDADGQALTGCFKGKTSGKAVTFVAPSKLQAGDVAYVTVKANEGGATATVKVYVDTPAKKVTLLGSDGKAKASVNLSDYTGKDPITLTTNVTPGKNATRPELLTSYSVNKSGIVKLEWADDAHSALKVVPLGVGTVKIKVMTPSGKAGTFTLTVK